MTFHTFNPSRPNPGLREKIKFKFLFSHAFVVPQNVSLKAFIKPFFISMQLLEMHGTGRNKNWWH